MRIEPPVSLPSEANPIPHATAAADPPLDPPADRAGSRGWRTAPNAEASLVVPSANSCRFVFPTLVYPAASSSATAAALRSGTWSANTADP